MDDILDIDAPSFAARTAHVAAAELYGLLSGREEPAHDWLGTRANVPMSGATSALSLFMIAQKVNQPETLWREASSRGYLVREARTFGELPPARRLAYEVFTRTLGQTHGAIHALQEAQRLAIAARQQAAAAAPLKVADSILEEHEPIGALVEGGAEFLKLQAARLDRRKFNGAEPSAFDHDGDGKPGGSKPKKRSIGEAAASRPTNRGGRGKKKTPAGPQPPNQG